MCINALGVTYDDGELDGYSLAVDVAAELRVPEIVYLGERVPVEVVEACLGSYADLAVVIAKQENGSVQLDVICNHLSTVSKACAAACRDCISNCVQSQFVRDRVISTRAAVQQVVLHG